jgi:hypothetical protein
MAYTKRGSFAISIDERQVRRHREIIDTARSTREAAKEAVARARALVDRLKEQRRRPLFTTPR